jgi:hypothetical protein
MHELFFVILCITCITSHTSPSQWNEVSDSCLQRAGAGGKKSAASSCLHPIIDRLRSKARSLSDPVSWLHGSTVRLRTSRIPRQNLFIYADRLNVARIRGGTDVQKLSDINWESPAFPNQIQSAIDNEIATSDFESSPSTPPSKDHALAYLQNESIAGNQYARYLLQICSNASFEPSLHSNLSSDAQAQYDNRSSAVEIFAQASRRGNAQAALLLGQVIESLQQTQS